MGVDSKYYVYIDGKGQLVLRYFLSTFLCVEEANYNVVESKEHKIAMSLKEFNKLNLIYLGEL